MGFDGYFGVMSDVSKNKHHILLIMMDLNWGGSHKAMLHLAEILKDEYFVTVCYTGEKMVDIEPEGYKIIRVKGLGDLKFLIFWSGFSLVVCFGDNSWWLLRRASKHRNFKILVSERTDPYLRTRKFSEWLKRKTYGIADWFVFQTEEARQWYPEDIRKRSEIIPNPLMEVPKKKWSLPQGERYILNVGRLNVHQKRQDNLLDAFAIVHRTHPEVRLKFAGDGMHLARLKKQARKLGIEDYVDFLGNRKDVLDLMAGAALFVLCSDYEGIPNVLIEALAVGVPCLSTDCSPGGARFLLKDGKHGVIVKRHDVKALSDGINDALSSDARLTELSKATEGALDGLDEETIAAKWKNCISGLLSGDLRS
jgi:glycosyltransferase involved in cell wall biosynthesis